MGHVGFDEYYLTEQDESTVLGDLRGLAVRGQPPRWQAVAPEGAKRRRPRGMRRRLHLLRRAASVVLAA